MGGSKRDYPRWPESNHHFAHYNPRVENKTRFAEIFSLPFSVGCGPEDHLRVGDVAAHTGNFAVDPSVPELIGGVHLLTDYGSYHCEYIVLA